MKQWELVYNDLQRRAERLGYDPPSQLGGGQSQVFEYRVKKEPVLLLAFRDLARKPDYAMPNRLWAEGLDLVLERYQALLGAGRPIPQAAAVVIDNIGNSYVVVMMNELLALYQRKGAPETPDGSRRFTFVVIREDSGYSLQMPYGEPPVRLNSVNTVDDLALLLKAAKQPSRPSRPAL